MPKVSRSRTIRASVESVWDLVSDPHNLPRWWPRIMRVEDVQERASAPAGRPCWRPSAAPACVPTTAAREHQQPALRLAAGPGRDALRADPEGVAGRDPARARGGGSDRGAALERGATPRALAPGLRDDERRDPPPAGRGARRDQPRAGGGVGGPVAEPMKWWGWGILEAPRARWGRPRDARRRAGPS